MYCQYLQIFSFYALSVFKSVSQVCQSSLHLHIPYFSILALSFQVQLIKWQFITKCITIVYWFSPFPFDCLKLNDPRYAHITRQTTVGSSACIIVTWFFWGFDQQVPLHRTSECEHFASKLRFGYQHSGYHSFPLPCPHSWICLLTTLTFIGESKVSLRPSINDLAVYMQSDHGHVLGCH